MIITVNDVLSKKPCKEWTEERLTKKLGKGKTLLQILNLRGVEVDDKIWCVTNFLDDKTNRAFAIWCARQCKTDVKEITDYIDTVERYYNGEATKRELDNADWAAYSEAYRAAYRAAYRTAYRTEASAAYSATYSAADWAADWATMRKKQLKKLKDMVREGSK